MKHALALLAIMAAAISGLPAKAAPSACKVIASYRIGGSSPTYDYIRVDSARRRIFVAHGNCIEVLDADLGKRIGQIGPVGRAHGIAVAEEFGHGFATDGERNIIVMFDLNNLSPLVEIKSTGLKPDSIEYDLQTKRIYVVNGGSNSVTVLDPSTGAVLSTLAMDAHNLEELGFDGRGHGFIADEDGSAVHVISTRDCKVLANWPLGPSSGGTGLAIDAKNHRVFVVCNNSSQLLVLDSDSGKVIATLPVGEDPDGLAFDPDSSRIFCPNRDGTLTVVQEQTPDEYSIVQTVKDPIGCKTIALDPKTHHIITCMGEYGPPPAPTAGNPHPKPPIRPETFTVVVIGE